MAEEFRSLVMVEAFGLKPETPEDFQWGFLKDHTNNSNIERLPIRNLRHLKKIISEENFTEENVNMNRDSDSSKMVFIFF